MTKEKVHEIYKGFIVTVRKDQAIICLGYTDAPENFFRWTKVRENSAVNIAKNNRLAYRKEVKREYGYQIVRLRVFLKEG